MLSLTTAPIWSDKLPTKFTAVLDPGSGGGSTLLPGATMLPVAVGSKLTVKNSLIGLAVVVGAFGAYKFLSPPKRKTSAPAISGLGWLFGKKRRRRSRR